MLQPRFMNSTASQSSSSGCVGLSPILPKLSSVATMPWPKWWLQMRLTITRAVSGFSGEPSHSASARLRPEVRPFAGGSSTVGLPYVITLTKPGFINEPRLSASPRIRKYEGGA